MFRLKGQAVSAGVLLGKARLLAPEKIQVQFSSIDPSGLEKEQNRLRDAVARTRAQLKKIGQDLEKKMGRDAALIIETQYLLLQDSGFLTEINDQIRGKLVKAEWAIKEVERKYVELFSTLKDLAFREKINDLTDVLRRLLENLGRRQSTARPSDEKFIIVAADLPPSETAKWLATGLVEGMVLDHGGETSHTAILARTLEIPAIINTKEATELIAEEDLVFIDSMNSEVIVKPGAVMKSEIQEKVQRFQQYRREMREIAKLPDLTRDGQPFILSANIELPAESELAGLYQSRGIGLFRTEFVFFEQKDCDEEHQAQVYREVARKAFPHPAVIRTFDLGRDKISSGMTNQDEENPSLGLMAVRMLLKEKTLLKTQLRAILKANESGNIRVLFPMITEIEEVFAVKELVAEVERELSAEGVLPAHRVQLGIMIEIPAAVKIIPHLKGEIEFLSIGTNDLIQYLLAVDRNNSEVAYLYSPFHPAVVLTLKEILREARAAGLEVTICGEMAAKKLPALMLLGLGFSSFSMAPHSIVEIKRVFAGVDRAYLEKTVRKLSSLRSRGEIEEYLLESLLRRFPDLLLNHLSY